MYWWNRFKHIFKFFYFSYLQEHVDNEIATYEPELFDESMLDFNRTILSRENEEAINLKVERMIIYLAPYFHIQATKQVFEWLIFRFQIHTYNAETIALALMPYHSTNSYGRFLSILKFGSSSLDWIFVEDFSKKSLPLPLNVLVRVCHGARNYHLVLAISNFIIKAIKLVGADFVENKLHRYFTFAASLLANVIKDPEKIDNNLISRIIPTIGIWLKSNIGPSKCTGLMIACQLVHNTSLNTEVAESLLKLILLKIKKPWLQLALDASTVICLRCGLEVLPRKPIIKLVRNRSELGLTNCLLRLIDKCDSSAFMFPFWKTLFEELKQTEDEIFRGEIFEVLEESMEIDKIDSKLAERIIELIFDLFGAIKDAEYRASNQGITLSRFPRPFQKIFRRMAVRFPNEFSKSKDEWLVRDRTVVDRLLIHCEIEDYEVDVIDYQTGAPERKRPKKNE